MFNIFTGLAGALLNAANQFVFLAFNEFEIVVGKFGPLLFELSFGDVPVAFHFQCIHMRDDVCYLVSRFGARHLEVERFTPILFCTARASGVVPKIHSELKGFRGLGCVC